MRAGGGLLVALVLVSASVTLQVLGAEDLYWEGEEDASNEFLEVKDEDLGITGHLRRFKRGFWDFFAETTSTTTESSKSSDTEQSYNKEDHLSGGDDELDNDLGSGLPDREDTEGEPREKTLRVTFVVNHPYHAEYNKRDSQEFKTFSTSLANSVNQLFDQLPGTQRASLVRIQSRASDEFTCKVTLDIVTTGYDDTDMISSILHDHIHNRRSLDGVVVSDSEFSSNVIDPGSAIDVCAADELTCDDGQCVVGSARCNGYQDCSDGSDEASCPPISDNNSDQDQESVTEYEPGAGPDRYPDQPVSASWLDSNPVVNETENEVNPYDNTTPATPSCRKDELQCDETRCVPASARCDGYADCYDGLDEKNCEGAPLTA